MAEPEIQTLKPGIWRHYKGPLYLVTGILRDCDSQEPIVEYYNLYDTPVRSCQPLNRFWGSVDVYLLPNGVIASIASYNKLVGEDYIKDHIKDMKITKVPRFIPVYLSKEDLTKIPFIRM